MMLHLTSSQRLEKLASPPLGIDPTTWTPHGDIGRPDEAAKVGAKERNDRMNENLIIIDLNLPIVGY